MKKYLLILIILFISNVVFGQKQGLARIDSLLNQLAKVSEDTNKIRVLINLCFEYSNVDPDSGITIGEQVLLLSEKINYKKGIAHGNLCIGINYDFKSNYPKAMEYYFKALKEYKVLNDKKNIAASLLHIGIVYDIQSDYPNALKYLTNAQSIFKAEGEKKEVAKLFGNIGLVYDELSDYSKSLECYVTGLKIYEELGDQHGIAVILGNIGNVYLEQSNFSKSLEYYSKSLKIFEEQGEKPRIATLLNNMGTVFSKQKEFDKALEYFARGLKIHEEFRNKYGISSTLNNIGNNYSAQTDYPKALEYFSKSLLIDKELGDKSGIAINLGSIGFVYFQITQTNKKAYLNRSFNGNKTHILHLAKANIDSAIIIGKEIGNLDNLFINYLHLSEIQELLGDSKEALESYKSYATLKDSVFNLEKDKELTQTAMQYDFDKKEAATKADQEKKDLLTQTEIQKQKSLRNNVATGGGALILASFVSFIFYRRKREAQMQADISTARVKTMTAQIEKHFVFGSLSSVKNLIAENPEKANELITRSSKFLRTTLSLSESTTISLKQELEATENYLQIEKIHHDDKFDFKIHIEEGVASEDIMVPPLIFQPIVENSIKHGFHGIDYTGEITIDINKSGSQLICKITDNGIGFKPKKDTHHQSFGTKLTRDRLELFNKLHKQNAMFNIEPLSIGVMVTLTLPIKYT